MRIQPVFNRNKYNKLNNTQFERKNNNIPYARTKHQYTGVASVDLAYASMYDNAIARDLKLMGLI